MNGATDPTEVACPAEVAALAPGGLPWGCAHPRLRLRTVNGLDAVHAAVVGGQCRYGVLPLECRDTGAITRSHDLLFHSDVAVVGELLLTRRTGGGAPSLRCAVLAGAHEGRSEAFPWPPDRLMLAALLPQRIGSLADVLAPFATQGLSIVHWCTRPARVEGWQYCFHFTVQLPTDVSGVMPAVQEARAVTQTLKVLGCFAGAARLPGAAAGHDGG